MKNTNLLDTHYSRMRLMAIQWHWRKFPNGDKDPIL